MNDRIFVIAPNYDLARRYAEKAGITKNTFRYVHYREDLYGLVGTTVLWLNRESRGDFQFTNSIWEIIRLARELADRERIVFRSVSMDDPATGRKA